MLKKSQIFMFDMILSFIILVLVLSLTFNYYMNVDENSDIYVLNRNILNGFSNTRINSLNNKEVIDLFRQNKIKNVENTIAQQVIEFYEQGTSEGINMSKDLTGLFMNDYLDKQMNFNVTLENASGVVIVLNTSINRPSISYNDATIGSVTQRRVFAFKNTTTFYGPYIFKVRIWK